MVRLEVLSGDPPCPGCVALIELAKQVAAKYEGELELTILEGAEALDLFEAYGFLCAPAAVANGTIQIAPGHIRSLHRVD